VYIKSKCGYSILLDTVDCWTNNVLDTVICWIRCILDICLALTILKSNASDFGPLLHHFLKITIFFALIELLVKYQQITSYILYGFRDKLKGKKFNWIFLFSSNFDAIFLFCKMIVLMINDNSILKNHKKIVKKFN
jgi:hypothetical protein